MKLKSFLISLAVVASSNVSAVDVTYELQLAQATFKDQIIDQTKSFVETTVNVIRAPFLNEKDIECLARNIYFEAGSEPLEGKVAVGVVTLNRMRDPRYPSTICAVVNQKTVVKVPQQVTETKTVKDGVFSAPKEVTETKTTWVSKIVYQFSWVAHNPGKIKNNDRWQESQAVAQELARNGYADLQLKYSDAMNFHNTSVQPGWKLRRIGRIGNHIFYEGPPLQGG
jgi:spore germination cell wall hydrolase CwlJ-like protein